MRKILFLIMVFELFIVACGELNMFTPTATAISSPVSIELVPTLIKEIKLETQTGTAYTLDWSPDGEMLAVASGFEITLLSRDLNKTHAVLQPKGGALAVTWSPDQTKFATVNGYQNPTIKLWDWDNANSQLTPVHEIQAGFDQYGVFWSPDGKALATLADDDTSTFQIWDASTREEIRKFELSYTTPLRTLSWSTDSSALYGAGESDGQMVIFALNVADSNVQEVAKFPVAEVGVFAFSPHAKKLVVVDPRGVAQILDIPSGKILTGFKTVDQPVDLAWDPNGLTLAILDYKTKLQLWSLVP
ncbi:MAG: WD40 repeat domain-containing protein [Chloroflexi bacterium]|nr:MAG: WD40 repeat domain-containing protein [Chloroflexota bacterium]